MSIDGPQCITVNNSQTPLNEYPLFGETSICTTTKMRFRHSLNFNAIPSKIHSFSESNKLILKLIWKCKSLKIQSWKRTKLKNSHILISKFSAQ